MLRVLEDEAKIAEAQRLFVQQFEQRVDERIAVKIGYQGGYLDCTVSWSSELDTWMCWRVEPGKKYWNAFGIGEPTEGENVSITCEINPPLVGINRHLAGVFLEDAHGHIYIAHRGKIGGGKPGVGKALFEKNYRGEWIEVQDGNRETAVALVGALSSPRLALQIREFVFEVDRIKGLVSSASTAPSPIGIPRADHDFREEFSGKKRYETKRRIEAQCDHGLIVNQLASALEGLGFRVGNDRNRDLFTFDSEGRVTTIFEVKTSTSTSSLYSGVGQLMLYSVDLPRRQRLILTIPEGVSAALEGKLNKLGIELLVYGWSEHRVIFPKLNSLKL